MIFLCRFSWLMSLLLSVCIMSSAMAQERFVTLKASLQREIAARSIPGAAVAVVEGDEVTFVETFGVLSVESGEAVKPDSLFRLGSTTKMFTATALVLLSEQGKLQLDAPIGKSASGLSAPIAALTLDQLLSHRSGLHDQVAPYGPHDDRALADAVRAWGADRFFVAPGAIFSYANPGYSLAGFVLQEASGKPFADQMSVSLFEPLGMRSTTFRPTLAMTHSLALGHRVDRGTQPVVVRPAANNVPAWPSGSMFSNVLELSRFTIAFMNHGRLEGAQVLPARVSEIVSARHAEAPGGRFEYGYGIERSMRHGKTVLEHAGSLLGYGSFVRMFPESKVAIIVLTNRTAGALPDSVEVATDLTTGLKPTPDESLTETKMSLAEVQMYAGRYSQGAEVWELVAQAGQLFLKADEKLFEVRKIGDYRFTADRNGSLPPIRFRLIADADGRPEYLFRSARSYKRN